MRKVTIARPFAVRKYEMTGPTGRRAWRCRGCSTAGRVMTRLWGRRKTRDKRVVEIRSRSYVEWFSTKTGKDTAADRGRMGVCRACRQADNIFFRR